MLSIIDKATCSATSLSSNERNNSSSIRSSSFQITPFDQGFLQLLIGLFLAYQTIKLNLPIRSHPHYHYISLTGPILNNSINLVLNLVGSRIPVAFVKLTVLFQELFDSRFNIVHSRCFRFFNCNASPNVELKDSLMYQL